MNEWIRRPIRTPQLFLQATIFRAFLPTRISRKCSEQKNRHFEKFAAWSVPDLRGHSREVAVSPSQDDIRRFDKIFVQDKGPILFVLFWYDPCRENWHLYYTFPILKPASSNKPSMYLRVIFLGQNSIYSYYRISLYRNFRDLVCDR